MKKQLLIILMGFLSTVSVAQTCNPQYADSTFGSWPDTTTNFATVYVGTPYIQILDFKVPNNAADIDPAYPGTIQSFRVTSVDGMPTGFSYQCPVANCQYSGGQNGCAQVSGTATLSQVGVYPLEIKISANVSVGPITAPIPYTFKGYKLKIEENQTDLSVSIISANEVAIYPNPATSEVTIYNADKFEYAEIYNLNGQLMSKNTIGSSEEKLNISDLNQGVYFIHLVKDSVKSVHKFVKK